MDGKHNFVSKAFSVIKPMDGMVGKDFEDGLANLKKVAEAKKPPPAPPAPPPETAGDRRGRDREAARPPCPQRRPRRRRAPPPARRSSGGRLAPGMASSSALVGKIRALLESQAHERQIAAAIVLGEIGAHDAAVREAAVMDALVAAATGGVAPVQRHALEALARLAAGKSARRVMPKLLPCFASRDDAVRRAAIDAAIAFGDEAVTPIRQRLATATDVGERRALEEVLGRVGGKDAFTALLAALDTTDVNAARVAALAVRQRVKDATPREKAGYLAAVTKLVRAKGQPATPKGSPSKKGGNPALVAGGLKILGYLEDPAALPTLLGFARDKRQPVPVREEAIVALRFTARGKAGARVAAALLDLAEKAPAELARPALYTMASLELPNGLLPRLKKIALGAEAERALLAIERLAQIATPPAADALAGVLAATQDRMRAEAAANALGRAPRGRRRSRAG